MQNIKLEKLNSESITICSTVWNDKWLLDYNYDLTKRINNDQPIHWIMVRQLPPQPQIKVQTTSIPNFKIIDGVVEDWSGPKLPYRVSIFTAKAMNNIVPYINTRFLLWIHPDFYVIRPNWINEILEYMKNNEIEVLGTPWHPRMYKQPRYTITPHFMIIDTYRVNIMDIDWSPVIKKKTNYFVDVIWKILTRIGIDRRRKKIGINTDVGFKFHKNYILTNSLKFESLLPVFKPTSDLKLGLKNRPLIEYFLPDRYCFIPKKKGAYTERDFASFGKPDFNSMGSEEYMWKGEPFGVHLRSRTQFRKGEIEDETELVENLLTKAI